MGDKINDREFKITRIKEEYDKRKTQKEVADMFKMNIKHVSMVTQKNNYIHTRKITQENRKENETINAFTYYDEYEFLDQYPIGNFKND